MTISRKELEINVGWAQSYPSLFSNALFKFHTECKDLKLVLTQVDRSREGFVTYIAEAA